LHAADYVAADIAALGVEGVAYTLLGRGSTIAKIASPIPGIFTVSNTLQAAACALQMGISLGTVRDGLRHLRGISGRMEMVHLPACVPFHVFIDYAHTPDALENLLRTARGFRQTQQRIVLVFGCGGERDREKRPLMAQIAARLADVIYVTSDNSRGEDPECIFADIVAGMPATEQYTLIRDRRMAIKAAIFAAEPGDIILLAGKGHERYEIDAMGKHAFDEREIAAMAVAEAFPYGKDEL
jgi:UDP-N-acetylmuramoyl-L-alanyl-D-glutamate--2,6-diaminopimelate ligase